MVNMSAKFDKEICNGLVSIVFTKSSQAWMEPRTDGTTAALLYPHRNALRRDKNLILAAILLKISQRNLKVICIQKNSKINI